MVTNYYNCFYNPETNQEDLSTAVDKLSKLTSDLTEGRNRDLMQKIITTSADIENFKLPMIVREVKKELERDPNRKVVVHVNSIASVNYISKKLKNYGDIKDHVAKIFVGRERKENINKFNENNNDIRVLILTKNLGYMNLSDKFGFHPRTMFIIPRYNFLEQYQLTGSVCAGKSDTTVKFVYGDGCSSVENDILDNLARKSARPKLIIPFPADFERYKELLQ